jgi:predicted outer membrane repeat protein
MKLGLISLALMILAGNSSAATIHVPAEQPSIAAGLAAASAGDTVLVACGSYQEWALSMPTGVLLRGETGDPGCVTIDAGGNSRVILFDGTLAGTKVEGITFTGGDFSAGPGMYFWHAVAEVSDCVIIDNTGGGFGGGVYVRYEDSEVSFRNCLFSGNHASDDGGAVYAQSVGSLSFTDCTFTGNSADRDGGCIMLYYSDCDLTGCTFDANSAAQYGAAVVASYSLATLDRCIVSDSVDGEAVFQFSGGDLALTCSNLFGNEGGDWSVHVVDQLGVDGNISADPLYCGVPGSGNYWLRSDSPSAASNSGCGQRMGAWDEGCEGTSTAATSWGRVKSLY